MPAGRRYLSRSQHLVLFPLNMTGRTTRPYLYILISTTSIILLISKGPRNSQRFFQGHVASLFVFFFFLRDDIILVHLSKEHSEIIKITETWKKNKNIGAVLANCSFGKHCQRNHYWWQLIPAVNWSSNMCQGPSVFTLVKLKKIIPGSLWESKKHRRWSLASVVLGTSSSQRSPTYRICSSTITFCYYHTQGIFWLRLQAQTKSRSLAGIF